MIYQTMTRNKVSRLMAKGWVLSPNLREHFYKGDYYYFEVAFFKRCAVAKMPHAIRGQWI